MSQCYYYTWDQVKIIYESRLILTFGSHILSIMVHLEVCAFKKLHGIKVTIFVVPDGTNFLPATTTTLHSITIIR